MKHTQLILIFFACVILCISCKDQTSPPVNNDPADLEGTWFRSYPNTVWGGHNQPSFERGESHVRMTFQKNGDFIYNRTTLGLYEGTTIDDTTAIVIESGTYTADANTIDIILNKRLSWDSGNEDMQDFAESGVNSTKYMDVTYEIADTEMNFVWHNVTDLITGEQETPGVDKFEEDYIKE